MAFPSIYTKFYFKSVLATHLNRDSVSVLGLNIRPCNAQGDGFLSTLHRVTVKFQLDDQPQSMNLVVKSDCTNEFSLEKIGSGGYDVQCKEIKFFTRIACEMEKIFGAGVIVRIIAADADNKILIFEDLKDTNFTMADRITGLDENHVRVALTKLAKFHAASLVMLASDPLVFDGFDLGMFSRKVDAFNKACMMLFTAAGEEVATWDGCGVYAEKLKKLREFFIENATRCFDIDERDVNVLNHGDVWTTNVMFRYDEGGKVEDAVIVS
jgi:hypothetical protein